MSRYIIGFLSSIVTTLLAFGLAEWHLANGHTFPTHAAVFGALIALALAQFCIQALFFLHIRESDEWHGVAFLFSLMVVGILVGGTLWIMANLQHNGVPFDGAPSPAHEH